MNNEFTLPATYPSVTRNLPEVTKLPTVTYQQVSRGRAADCSILQPKAKRQSRTQSKTLTGSLSNTQKEEHYMTEERRKNTVRKRGDERKSVRLEYGKTDFRDIYGTVT